MDNTTLIIIIILVILLLGGGFYGRGRWYNVDRTIGIKDHCAASCPTGSALNGLI